MKKKELRVRCWIDIDGVRFFGPGRSELLAHIDEYGSISKAAKSMGMSYKKAWDMVDEMNSRGRKPLVVAHKGGDKGGGAALTERGKEMIDRYNKLMTRLNMVIEKHGEILKLV